MSLESFSTGHFGFSATPLRDLGAAEYTLVTIVVDESGSVSRQVRDIEQALDKVIESCRLSPHSDNLMVRVVRFNSNVNEVHGFKLLPDIKSYTDVLTGSGMTSLYEATTNALVAMNTYGKNLSDQDYTVNGILVVITDGMNNITRATRADVKRELTTAVSGENLESLISILVGVDTGESGLKQYLDDFKNESGFTQFEWMQDLTPKSLARLANFISRSVSSQSKALGSGSPSQALSF